MKQPKMAFVLITNIELCKAIVPIHRIVKVERIFNETVIKLDNGQVIKTGLTVQSLYAMIEDKLNAN